jgi:diguanylate cyclase (GGDEF)-like protein/PAS domain S-box-containing protein
MSIKFKLIGGFLGIALLVGISGVIAVLEQLQAAEQAALIEAKHLSETIGVAVTHDPENLQSFITQLHALQERDVEVVDLDKRILADAVLEDVGTILTYDTGNEVGLTMRDGHVRTFIETSPEYPQGIRQLVAPLKNQEGKIIGAIIVEYTALYEELHNAAAATGRIITAYTFACVILALVLGYFVSTSISDPILKLRDAAAQIEQGQFNVTFPHAGRDETGQLVTSFAHMTNQLRQTQMELEQRIAERTSALRQSEERFKLMAWATKDAVWDWDLLTNQIWWGEGLQKVFHYSSETAQPSPEWRLDHIYPDDRARVGRVIDQALEGGMEFWSKEYRFQRKDGTYADIIDRGYIIRDGNGKPYRMIGAMLDITERKQMESSLLQANEQMGQFLDELQYRNREIGLLNEMGHLLQGSQTAEEAYRVIGDLTSQMFPGTAGALYLLNTPRTLLSAAASWGELPDPSRTFVPEDCLAFRRGSTRPLSEDQAGGRCLHVTEPQPLVTLCLPMQIQGETLGVLHLQSQDAENLDQAKRQLAYTVVEQTGMALSNLALREALREQSIRDPLTGLYNRRYMEEVLKQQLSRVTRQLHPLGIIMIDIDQFKRFNDTYGHAAGDALLRQLGHLMQRRIRGEDIACRYGGEEFTLILPDASLETAQQRAEDLRQAARQLRVQAGGLSHKITLSLGVAIYPQHGRTIENVLRAADAALYRAKQEGRDQVVVAEKES